jgi:hypothetical protein
MIRIGCPGCVPIDVQLFDQGETIPMVLTGGVIRITASPNAVRALVWERSKAMKPSMRIGALVVRKQAHMDLFRTGQEVAAGISALGFVVAQASPTPPRARTEENRAASRSGRMEFPTETESSFAKDTTPVSAMEIAQSFGECLAAARSALGPDARDEDVRFAAKVTFDQVMGKRIAGCP